MNTYAYLAKMSLACKRLSAIKSIPCSWRFLWKRDMSQHLRMLLTWLSRRSSGVSGELESLLAAEVLAEESKAGTRREAVRAVGMAAECD